MTTPLFILLGFAGWTLLTLLGGVSILRWRQILNGTATFTDFPADTPHGSPAYRRAMRAHANCLENLPVYGAIVVVITAMGLKLPLLDDLAIGFMAARIFQTVIHILCTETSLTVALRFLFFFTQIICLIWMGMIEASAAL